jgi:microcystin-dependent protein
LMSTTSPGSAAAPGPTMVPAATASTEDIYSNAGTNAALAPGAVSTTTGGGGLPHENRQPYSVVNYIIALQGVFPSQS